MNLSFNPFERRHCNSEAKMVQMIVYWGILKECATVYWGILKECATSLASLSSFFNLAMQITIMIKGGV